VRVMTATGSIARHGLGAILKASLVVAIVAMLTLAAAYLTGGGPPGAKSVLAARTASAVWVNELSAGSGQAAPGLHVGDTFTVGYSTNERQPWVLAQCYANGTTVLSGSPNADGTIWAEWFSVYPGGPLPQHFVLGQSVSPIWTGGGADCTLTLAKLSGKYNGALGFSNVTVLASTAFTVAP
jgi:hypothetical protein